MLVHAASYAANAAQHPSMNPTCRGACTVAGAHGIVWLKRLRCGGNGRIARAQVLRLWEALWSGHLSAHLHLFMAAGVLGLHRRAIMEVHPLARMLEFSWLRACNPTCKPVRRCGLQTEAKLIGVGCFRPSAWLRCC